MEMAHAVERLTTLVHSHLGGAVLRDWHLVEDYPGEQAYIVLWSSEHECGTHRAVLRKELHECEANEMLVWGHLYPGENQGRLADARRDFNERSRG